jgi:predicted anti-sigma-YlaC factor YlaD
MCHQPFETWFLEEKEITREERKMLQSHLDECTKCRKLEQSWQSVRSKMETSQMISPRPGFTSRWKNNLEIKMQEQHMRQVFNLRRFFLYLSTANVLTMILLVSFIMINGSPVNWLVSTLNQLLIITSWLGQAQHFVVSLIQALPPIFPITFWIILTSGLSTLALIWVVSLWKISIKGEIKS